jgi:hypothetical protein
MYGDPRKWYGHFPFLIVFALADFIIRARELEFERNGETLNVDVSTPIVQAAIDRGNVIVVEISCSIVTSLARGRATRAGQHKGHASTW